MRIGAKARVVDWRSVYSGEVVELIEETDDAYVFANEKHKRGTLTVGKNVAQEFISWECDNNDAGRVHSVPSKCIIRAKAKVTKSKADIAVSD